MCVSVWPAYFSRTITGTCEVLVEDRLQHILWYQNRVGTSGYLKGVEAQVFEVVVRQALAGAPWKEICLGPMELNRITVQQVEDEVTWRKAGQPQRTLDQLRSAGAHSGNALIIPLPGLWESIRLLDSSKNPDILNDVARALALPKPDGPLRNLAALPNKDFSNSAAVFMQYDIYDIVLAPRASAIPSILDSVQKSKRPAVNAPVFTDMDEWYQCPVALCCFANDEMAEAKPLAFAFEPLNPEKIVVYTLDGHIGLSPDLAGNALMDHTIFVGSKLSELGTGTSIQYSDELGAEIKLHSPERIMGLPLSGYLKNGDIVFSTAAVREGKFEGVRSAPPFASDAMLNLQGPVIKRDQPYQSQLSGSTANQ